MTSVPCVAPSLSSRLLSAIVARYPFDRGRTWLRRNTSPWLVGRLRFGPWVRVSGLVDAEWEYLTGHDKEQATTEFLTSYLKPGMNFVDVGANIGYFTLLAASLGARAIAYEPTPKVFERLRENIALNGFRDVTPVNAAVAEKNGRVKLYKSEEDPEANSIFGMGECMDVPAVALDEDLAIRGIREVQVLKIDAEGAEPFVLEGARNLLRSECHPLVVIEVNSFCLQGAGSSPASLLAKLREFHYECVEIESGSYKGGVVANVLAVPSAVNIPAVTTITSRKSAAA